MNKVTVVQLSDSYDSYDSHWTPRKNRSELIELPCVNIVSTGEI